MFRKYPSLFLLIFVITGIVLSDKLRLPGWPLLVLAVICFVLAGYMLMRNYARAATVLAGATVGLFAAFHFSSKYVDLPANSVAQIAKERPRCVVYGKVSDWPVLKPDRTEIKVTVDSIRTAAVVHTQGAVLLKVSDTTTALQLGDRVAFQARLYPLAAGRSSQGFDYRRYLTLKGVQALVYMPTVLGVQIDRRSSLGFLGLTDAIRDNIRESLHKNLSPVAAALAGGILIGETREIPVDVYILFRNSGTLHLLAVSGSNVALVLLFAIILLRPFRLSLLGCSVTLIVVVALFAALSYGEPSVMRASLMAALVILARLMGRAWDLNNIISLAALIILLVDPGQLYSIGFQLSFCTAWGLILLVPRVVASFKERKMHRWLRWLLTSLIIALVAQLSSMPLIALYFGRLPILSVLANIVIVPMVSVAVVATLAVLVIAFIWPLLGFMAGSLVDPWFKAILVALRFFGGDHVPVVNVSGVFDGSAGVLLVVAYYVLLILLVWSVQSIRARRLFVTGLAVLVNLVLLTGVVKASPGDRLSVEAHPVPGGSAVIVKSERATDCDLIITGLARKTYPIDDRVLAPLLEQDGIERVNRLFVLSGDYNALDDAVRLADRFQTDTIFVPRTLEHSLSDVRRTTTNRESLSVRALVPDRDSVAEWGYKYGPVGLRLNAGNTRLVITDKLNREALTPCPATDRCILLIGANWYPTADDWVKLHSLGFAQIICSRIRQSAPAEADPNLDPDSAFPDYLHDLFRDGPFQLSIPLLPQ